MLLLVHVVLSNSIILELQVNSGMKRKEANCSSVQDVLYVKEWIDVNINKT